MFDTRLNELFQKLKSPLLNQIVNGITFFGSFYIVLFMAYLLLILKGKKEVFTFSLTLGITYLFVVLTKQAFMIKRPFNYLNVEKLATEQLNPLSYSFVSGHSMIASLIPTYLITRTKKKIYALLYIYTILIMLSRIYLGVHYYIDTIAGALVGILVPIYYSKIINLVSYHNEYFLLPLLGGISYLIYKSNTNTYHSDTIFQVSLISFFFLGLYFSKYSEKTNFKYQYFALIIIIFNSLIIIGQYLVEQNIIINNDNFIYLIIISFIINLYLLLFTTIIFKLEALNEKINSKRIKVLMDWIFSI